MVPSNDLGGAGRSFQQAEEEKQLWLKPTAKKTSKGDFVARIRKEADADARFNLGRLLLSLNPARIEEGNQRAKTFRPTRVLPPFPSSPPVP